jgi:hypothetical protein
VKRRSNFTATCPVSQTSHDWEMVRQMGLPNFALCKDCRAEWIGEEEEWYFWEKNFTSVTFYENVAGTERVRYEKVIPIQNNTVYSDDISKAEFEERWPDYEPTFRERVR